MGKIARIGSRNSPLNRIRASLFSPISSKRYRYGVALLSACAAIALRLALLPSLGTRVTYLTFYPAVMLAALYGGVRSGLLATALSAVLADYFLIEPVGSLTVAHSADILGIVVFLFSCVCISFLVEAMRRAQRQVATAESELQHADELKRNEQRLRTLNRTLRALKHSSQALARATDEPSLLREVCRIIVEECGHAMVWVGFAENDAGKSIRPAAYSGFDEGYLEALKLTWADTERGRGPTGRAIRTGTVSICRDMPTDPDFAPWREEARRRGYASSIAFPLSCGGSVIGALTLYAREPDPFSDDELGLLTELASDLAFGICTLRLRQVNVQAEAESKRSQCERDLTIAFLRMVNLSKNSTELLRASALFFKEHADCDAVGIRLRNGPYFPYCQTLGFSDAFLESEQTLCTGCKAEVAVSLACLCGKVINGHPHPKELTFTPHGSFWTNDSSALLQLPFDPLDLIRGRCIQEGYGSIVLLPLHDGPARLGLVQLNASRKDAFTPEAVSLWERLSDHLAVAVAKFLTEEALRDSEQRIQQALHVSHSFTFEWLPASDLVLRSTSCGPILNLTGDAACRDTGERYFQHVHPDDRERFLQVLHGLTPATPSYLAEYRVTRGDDTIVVLEETGQASFNDAGQLQRIVGVTTDITAHKHAAQQLFEATQRLQAMMAAVPVGISFSDDATCQRIGGNPAVLAQFDVSPEENLSASAALADAPGRKVKFFSHGQPITDAELPLQRAVAENRVIPPMELEVHLPSGRRWFTDASGAPVRDAQGNVIGGIAVTVDITERKQTEEILRFLGQCNANGSGEDFFQALARYLAQSLNSDFVCIDRLADDQLSAQTLAVFHSGRFEDNVSYTLKDTPCGDVVGRSICCFPRNVRELFAKDAVLQKLQAESYLGTTLWSSQGQPIGLIAVIGRQPLTDTRRAESLLQMVGVRAAGELERQQTETELRKSREDLNRAQVVAQVGSWRLNVQRDELAWSDESWRIFGIPKGTPLTYETFLSTIHPDDRAYVHEKWSAALRGEPYNIEHRIVVDGAVKWVRERAELEFGPAGALQGGFGTTQDITERKLAETVNARYELIAQYARDPLLLVDLEGNIIEANQAAVQLYGYSRKELLKLRLHALRQDDAEVVDLQMQRARTQGVLFESVHVCKDGVCVPVEVSARGVFIEGKEMLLSVIRDIRQRKETEMSLRRAKEDAERASQAKSDFLASMSHELRTPLNAIMGFSQVLENEYFGSLSDKQKEYVNDIYESGKHLLSLINDILELSKIEAGKMEPRWSRVNVESLLEHSRVFVKEKCFKQDIHLDFEIDDPVRGLAIRADERRFKQIMYNLLSNAAKFTLSGGSIRVWARLRKGDVPALEVSVSDTGIGIAPEHQERVFEAFYQVHQGTLNKTPGTGLGLSLVKQLVAMHGGRVWLTSEGEGHGSRFTFVIPAIDPVPEDTSEGGP